jgi:hypothetical protein
MKRDICTEIGGDEDTENGIHWGGCANTMQKEMEGWLLTVFLDYGVVYSEFRAEAGIAYSSYMALDSHGYWLQGKKRLLDGASTMTGR